jgi:hypothetical protein
MNVEPRHAAVLILAVTLSSCYMPTPPGKLKESDFNSRSVVLDQSVPDSLAKFYDGIRYCGPYSGGVIFVTHHGVPECAPIRSDGTATCDLYIPGAYGGRSDFVLGRIDLTPESRGTTAILRVQTHIANQEATLGAWEQFLRGNARQVCPSR